MGNYVIDNNPVENSIRPMAIGRKNYLFCGNHDTARDTAMFYTFMGCCKPAKVNPLDWLTYVLEHINETKTNDLQKFFPVNWKENIEQ
jgi:transposase